MTTPAGQRAALALVDAQAAARQTITAAVLAAVRRAFGALSGGFYDADAVDEYVRTVAEVVAGGREMVAGTTDEYLRAQLQQLGVSPPRTTASPAPEPRGIPVEREYVRPVKTYRYARLEGLEEFLAEERALERAELIAEMDLALAARDAARDLLSRTERVTGWRRVIHPEVSAGGTCGLCIAAADRVYPRAELLPLHERCACEVLPIVGERGGEGDPGLDLNAETLKQLYKAAGSTGKGDLARTRWTVEQHGELGPVLRAAGDNFRDAEEVQDLTGSDRPAGAD